MIKLEPPYKYKLFKTLERAEAFQKEVGGEIYNYLAGGVDKESYIGEIVADKHNIFNKELGEEFPFMVCWLNEKKEALN